MKKLLLILLLCVTAYGQSPYQKPNLGMRINRGHPLGDPVGCWFMNEDFGSYVYDLSGNGNTAIFGAGAASPTWGPGKFGSTISFDGDDYIECERYSTSLLGMSKLTLLIWVNPVNYTGNPNILSMENKAYRLRLNETTGKLWYYLNCAGGIKTATTEIVAPINQWSHLVLVYDGVTIKGYLNSVEGYSTDWAGGDIDLDLSEKLVIGAFNPATEYFNGQLDLPMIYNRDLLTTEIAQIYQNPFCLMEPLWDWNLYFGMSFVPPGAGQFIFIN